MMSFLNSESASCISFEEAANLLKTDLKVGLNLDDIQERRKLYSFNEFEIKNSDPLWLKYLENIYYY